MNPMDFNLSNFSPFNCAKTARLIQEKHVENCEQSAYLCTKQFSNSIDKKSFQFLGTNTQQLIHRVIRLEKPVFAGLANVNNIFSLH
jgi:hypothetical protein